VEVLVGTSGWQYDDWRGPFYPPRLAKREWLGHLAGRLATLEINNTFYRLPERSTFEGWRRQTPPGFVVAVKASRYLTHVRRLRSPSEPVARLVERIEGLEDRLGPVLVQLPPNLTADLAALDDTLVAFPAGLRVTVEFRHRSWFTDAAAEVLRAHNAALCLADGGGRRTPWWRTADWGYLRMHAGRATPVPCYGRAALRSWVVRLGSVFAGAKTVYVYFNNDHLACAPTNALTFVELLGAAGIQVRTGPGLSGSAGKAARVRSGEPGDAAS
jgi:uncharacterized protein YecE (DUF72 family)